MTFAEWLDAQPEYDAELARRLGISPQRLSYYRHGKRVPMTAEAVRLAAATGLPIEAFFSHRLHGGNGAPKLPLPQTDQRQRAAIRGRRRR